MWNTSVLDLKVIVWLKPKILDMDIAKYLAIIKKHY